MFHPTASQFSKIYSLCEREAFEWAEREFHKEHYRAPITDDEMVGVVQRQKVIMSEWYGLPEMNVTFPDPDAQRDYEFDMAVMDQEAKP